jgi:hypothetical protein
MQFFSIDWTNKKRVVFIVFKRKYYSFFMPTRMRNGKNILPQRIFLESFSHTKTVSIYTGL